MSMNNNCDDCVKSISCKLLKAGSSLSTINIKKMEKELPLKCEEFKPIENNNCSDCLYLHSCNRLNNLIDGWNTSAYPNRMKKELPLECGNFKEKNNSECYSDIDPLTLIGKEGKNE